MAWHFDWFLFSDYFGVVVFAISGALAAGKRAFDIFGVMVIAFVTALGGGTLRDLILGIHPVSWVRDPVYLWLVIGASLFTVLAGKISHRFDNRAMLISDAFGLAVFTVIGVQAALYHAHVSAPIAVIMGIMTGVAGGVIRDIICNDIPLILQKEIYATACGLGAIVYTVFDYFQVDQGISTVICMLSVLLIRLVAVISRWNLPAFKLQHRE